MHLPATIPAAGLMPNAGFSAEAYIASRVFAPRIPRIRETVAGTNVSIVENALGYTVSVPTVTVADAGGDTTTWPMLATSQTGNMTVASDGDLTYNAATGALTAITFNGALSGAATQVTVADESADTTCFLAFVTAATGNLGIKTNAALAFDSSTGALTLGAAASIHTWTGREFDLLGANGTNGTTLYVANTTNTAVDASAAITVGVGGTTSTGDPQFRLDIPGGTSWYMGANNDDSDKFVIGTGVAVGLNAALAITTGLNAEFFGTVTATGFIGPLTGDVTGNVSGNAGTVTVADAGADTTTWPLVAVNQTGSESPRTDAGLTYNANTNALSTTTFIGALTGNASTATALATPRTIGNVSFDGTANIVPETIASVNEATDTSCFLLFITASGTQSLQPKNNAGLTYNSNTNNLTATTFTGALSGNATTATTATVGTTVTVANEATDTTCFINFTTAATGDLGVKTNADLTYNSSTDQFGVKTINLTGGQITFPSTQAASTDVNTLDDYEEGTWTPTLTFATPGTLNVVYSVRVGGYIKIGKQVAATCYITTSTFTLGTATGALQVTGMPFTSENTTNLRAFCAVAWQGVTKANYTDLNAMISENASLVTFLMSGSAQNVAQLTQADTPSGGTVSLRFTMTYRASA